ncbi:MAG: diadenylate cyclase CdaA [Deltaproteobacteria bacterium]|nr:MAG: diadenylate cyclase CdaA [Deltaproteobacteria bacterium]
MWEFLRANFDPVRDTAEILIVAAGIYWLLLLIRGTRATQILMGLFLLVVLSLLADLLQLATLSWILGGIIQPYAVLIVIVLFQHDIRRGLARVGRGLFRSVAQREVAFAVEEIVRATQVLAQKRVGALIVIERETGLDDMIEHGTAVDASVSKELLISLFLPYSPLHDGAVVIQNGRLAYAGSVLPLTLRQDLPEGVGTRHRAAVGITEETDALVVVVSEETGTISVVLSGEMVRELDAPRLRVILRDVLSGTRQDLAVPAEGGPQPAEESGLPASAASAAGASSAVGPRPVQ